MPLYFIFSVALIFFIIGIHFCEEVLGVLGRSLKIL